MVNQGFVVLEPEDLRCTHIAFFCSFSSEVSVPGWEEMPCTWTVETVWTVNQPV